MIDLSSHSGYLSPDNLFRLSPLDNDGIQRHKMVHLQNSLQIIKRKKRNRRLALATFVLIISYFSFSMLKPTGSTYTHQTVELPKLKKIKEKLINKKLSTSTEPISEWHEIRARKGDSLAIIFKRCGLKPQTLQALLHNNPHAKELKAIKPDQQIKLLIRNKILDQLIMPISNLETLSIIRQDTRYLSKIESQKMTLQTNYVTATIQGSLYGTANRMKIPYKLIKQMTDIFNWDINFARDVRAGDQFTILYKAYYLQNKLMNTGDILAVTYTNKGTTHQAIRHETKDGDVGYFSPAGVSLKKAFSRYPIQFSHISSTFSLSRMHPILHYKRPHKGIDLAAPIGTPIHATGDGRIEAIDRHPGYGNMIKISHQNTYTSLYAHLLRFQKGLSRGSRVKRGQIIGYVGQTGLADGPHCHYEFHVHHVPHNPSTVPLPRDISVSSREMATFKAHAQTTLAQLKLYETAQLAKNNPNSRKKTA